MAAEPFPIRAEALLQHQEFVRALARSLVRDEDSAGDVAQETWLTALRHPPRAMTSVRAWLAHVTRSRARDLARVNTRRVARERIAARAELDDSATELRERVEMQHKVVEAVLSLREPYKSVILLHYYEGLSAAAIAARRHAPAGTVRAQLSRAHDLLRERLDAEHGGDRRAWSAALSALARRTTAPVVAAKLVATAVVVILALAVPNAWRRLAARGQEPVGRLPSSPSMSTGSAGPEAQPILSAGAADSSPSRASLASVPESSRSMGVPTLQELEARSIPELLQLAVQSQRVLRQKLLDSDEETNRKYADLLRTPGVSLTRVRRRAEPGFNEGQSLLGVREGGAYFSFATRSHDYDAEPDIELNSRGFMSGFYGASRGFLLDLGERALADLPASRDGQIPRADPREQAAWELLGTDAHATENEIDKAFAERAAASALRHEVPAVAGHSYLVRSIMPGEHDLLACFADLEQDDEGALIAWRVLATWPIQGPRDRQRPSDPFWMVPPAPTWMTALAANEVVEFLRSCRRAAHARLLEIPKELAGRYPEVLALPDTGLARILERGHCGPLVSEREGGAFYSFATQSNDFDREPDLMLESGRYVSGRGWDTGLLVDLGQLDLAAVGTSARAVPAGLVARDRESWEFLWNVQPTESSPGREEKHITPQDRRRVNELRLDRGEPAALDHTYVLRSIVSGRHDLVVAFQTVAVDEHGHTLLWRILQRRPAPRVDEKR